VETIMAAPTPINYHQAVTRWVIDRLRAVRPDGA
jgi:hypothetical protein